MKNKKINYIIFWVGFLCFLAPKLAYADAGIPILMLTFPAMIILLIPVALIEATVYTKEV